MKRDGYSGSFSWQNRRELCDSLTIESNGKFQSVPDEVEDLIKTISTRGADFDSMALDEKQLLVDLGIFITIHIHRYINKI